MKNKVQAFVNHNPLKSAALLGGLFTLGFAPFHFWIVSMLALAGLLYLLGHVNGWKSIAKLGFVFGFTHHLSGVHWVARSMYAEYSSWLLVFTGGALAVAAMAVYLALYIVLALLAYKKLPVKYQNPLTFSVIWLVFEFIRAHLPSVFPWNLVGYVWAGNNELLQLAAFGEVWLMSFAFALSSSLLLWKGRRGVFLSFVLLVLCWNVGHYRLAGAKLEPLGLSFALIQGNVPQTEKWNKNLRNDHMRRYVETSRAHSDVDLFIWPEMAVVYDVTRSHGLKESLSQGVGHVPLLLGAPRLQRDDTQLSGYKAYNGAFLLDGQGQIVQEFDKEHLIPYGEFIPLREYLPKFVLNIVGHRTDYVSGSKPRLMSLPQGKKAIVLICGESAIPSLSRAYVQDADFIINITNDAWFDFTVGPHQHFVMSKVRAVSAGLPVVRVANTGRTAVIDRYGRVVNRIKMNQLGVLKWDGNSKL